MIRTLSVWAGLTLGICLVLATVEVTVLRTIQFADLLTAARTVGATAWLYAALALPLAVFFGALSRRAARGAQDIRSPELRRGQFQQETANERRRNFKNVEVGGQSLADALHNDQGLQ